MTELFSFDYGFWGHLSGRISNRIAVDFNDNYSVIQQNFTCHMAVESARKRKMHVELESLHLQHVVWFLFGEVSSSSGYLGWAA